MSYDAIVPEDKDWTWTLSRPCPDCGFEAATVAATELPGAIAQATLPWAAVLTRADVRARPTPSTWSPLEYACHVRDVCTLFTERLGLILGEDEPSFANWNQDETARAENYAAQDPAEVAPQLASAAQTYAAAYASVPADGWERRGLRSDGSPFTALTLGQYGLHDLVHHVWDVRG